MIAAAGAGGLVHRRAVDVGALLRSTVTWVGVGVGSGLVLLLGTGLTIGGAVRWAQRR